MASNKPRETAEEEPFTGRPVDNRLALPARKSMGRLLVVTSLGTALFACSSTNNQGSTAAGVGGAGTGVGGGAGAKATGGSGAQVSGTSSTGGSSAASQGGSAAPSTGGATAASTAAGGASTGGTPASTGGAATGGAATGGNSATSGTGGSATGGAATGGAATGGQTSAGTGGAATGGAATGGTSSIPVTPTMVSGSDYRFTLTACQVVFDVNPQVGARISGLTLNGTNIIVPYVASTDNADSSLSGSTFWTSPQSAWDGNISTTGDWPAPVEINKNPYTAAISGNHVILTGTANTNLGASVTKDLSADAGTCWITLLYTIKATKGIQAAPWEITRVPRGGLAFFPSGTSMTPGPLAANTTTTTAPAMVWFNDASQSATSPSGAKLVADGTGGWLAYALGGNLFIKKFTDVQPASFAPGEGDVEIYPGSGYLELEVQGVYTTLTTGGTLPWTTQWRVVAIPSSVTVAAGSATLATFAQQQAAM
jgi:hypothetical protein